LQIGIFPIVGNPKMEKIKRIYHPYYMWEEVAHNMWSDVSDRKVYLDWAIGFTGNHFLYGQFMIAVANNWKYSCENALTDLLLNRKAWIGHAACALANNCPEDIVREAWKELTNEQRLLANREAERAILHWEASHLQSQRIHTSLGTTVL